MKQFIKNSSLFTLAFFFAQITIAQTDFSYAVSYVDNAPRKVIKSSSKTISNEQIVLSQIIDKVTNNIVLPEELLAFYNSDVSVLASFEISKSGLLKDIQIVETKGDVMETVILNQLNKITQVAPVISNGTVINKRYFIPFIFKLD